MKTNQINDREDHCNCNSYGTELTALKHQDDDDEKFKSNGFQWENNYNDQLTFTKLGNGSCMCTLPENNNKIKEVQVGPGWKTLFYNYSQDTTLHGVRYITLETRFVVRRLFWLLVTCGAIALFLYYLINRVSFYLQYQKSVNVEVNYVDKVEFPAVTICNQNNFKLTSSANGGYYPEVHRISHSLASTGALSCHNDEFKCDNKCIKSSRVCDGIPDCQDETDETTKKCGCMSMKVTGSVNSSVIQELILNKQFEYDRSQHINNRQLYYTYNDIKNTVYLFYQENIQSWVFSTRISDHREDILMSSEDAILADKSITPSDYKGAWVNDNTTYDIKLTCISPNAETQNMDSLAKTKVKKLGLNYMYDNGSHHINDMIQGCTWKGRTCTVKDFEVLDTDYGRCFKYMPPEPVEQSGPGFGLAITLNIQQYEYTKNTQDGVGVQVLLHNPKEPPVMSERAFAISPGLYTMVSIERTEVNNLAPPWGKCGVKDLEYYSDYSVATCTLNCLNKLSRSICNCKDVYMPDILDKSAHYENCGVHKYIDCWKPKLEEIRKHGNLCSCTTPCSETMYVPSLSFASITSDQDVLSGEDLQKMITMQENLIEAREITYRIQVDKYIETMRMFKSTIRQTMQTDTKLLMTTEVITHELTQIKSIMSQVNSDCLWFMGEQYKLIKQLKSVQKIITEIYDTVKDGLVLQLEELYFKLRKIYNCWDRDACGFNYCMNNDCGESCCCGSVCYHPRANTWRYMLQPWYTHTKDIFRVILMNFKQNIQTNITNILSSETFSYRLTAERLNPLMPYLRTHCRWCINGTKSLFYILQSTLLEALSTQVIPSIKAVQNTLDEVHDSYFHNGGFLNFTRNSLNRYKLFTEVKHIALAARGSLSIMEEHIREPIQESIDMAEDLLRLISPKCGSELQKLYNEYTDQHDRMDADINLLNDVVKQHGKKFSQFQKKYRANSLSLTELHKTSGSTELVTYVQGVNVTLDSTFKVRSKATERIQNHISVIYYWISAQVSDNQMSNQSLIWKKFDIESPTFTTKVSGVSDGVPIDQQYLMYHVKMEMFWQQYLKELEMSRVNMGKGVQELLSQLHNTRSYLQHFVDGNQISESFYQKNFLQIDIFYKELTERNIVQQKAYELPALLGEVGGLMGLLLGASVMTIVEFTDLIVYNAFNKCVEKKQKFTRKRRMSKMYS